MPLEDFAISTWTSNGLRRTGAAWLIVLAGFLASARAAAPAPSSHTWWDGFNAPWLDAPALSLAEFGGELIAFGGNRAGNTRLGRVGRLHEGRWLPLAGFVGSVTGVLIENDGFFAAGRLDLGDGRGERPVIQWDGRRWKDIGSPTHGGLLELLEYKEGRLFASETGPDPRNPSSTEEFFRIHEWSGATFTQLGGFVDADLERFTLHDGRPVLVQRIRRALEFQVYQARIWDGSNWQNLGAGFDGRVSSLVSAGGHLYATAQVRNTPTELVYRVYRLGDDGEWQPLGDLPGSVSLVAFGERWIVAVERSVLLGIPARFAELTPEGWQSVSEGLNLTGFVPLGVFDGRLYAAGHVTEGPPSCAVAHWDGAAWTRVGAGLSDLPGHVAIRNGTVHVSGQFWGPTGHRGMWVSAWDGSRWAPVELVEPGMNGLNGRVRVLELWRGQLAAGGDFLQGGDVITGKLALWNGTTWSAPGAGIVGGAVTALAEYDGSLVAGGTFSEAGDVPAVGVARWDGTSWSSLGGGLNGEITDLVQYRDELIVSGRFTPAGDDRPERLARWDGQAWKVLPLDMASPSDEVTALAVYRDRLYAAGRFESADGRLRALAVWDGRAWSSAGTVESDFRFDRGPGTVTALAVLKDRLVVGGAFDYVDGLPATHGASFDGTNWTPFRPGSLDGELAFRVTSLTGFNGRVAAAGVVGDAPGLFQLGESGWERLGSDFAHEADALAAYGAGRLFVGGQFQTVGETASYFLARLDEPAGPIQSEKPILSQSHPNPFRVDTHITFDLPEAVRVTLSVFDVQGREVSRPIDGSLPAGPHDVVWDGRDGAGRELASGVYFYRLETPTGVAVRRLVKTASDG